jgi:vitamin B12 transporter
VRCLIALSLVLAFATHALAQDVERVPPRLLAPIVPEYPETERARGTEPAVVLRLTIDAEGRVTEAEVVESAGPAFDDAARSAVMLARFDPARRGGVPIAARISLRVDFRLPIVRPEVEPAPIVEAPEQPREGPIDEPSLGVAAEVERDRGAELARSADAVHVVDTRAQRGRAADLGDVLGREQGVAVRRAGGLGSQSRFSLNGLYDNQIRFFLDGVPLALAGYPFGVADVPVSLVDRVEIYRGVVPIRLGADALGGAVNLVSSDAAYHTMGSASYQVGSYETYRASLTGRWRHDESGFVGGLTLFADHTDNGYPIDVEVADERGRLSPARVRRFHDAYTAWGGTLELAFARRPWARLLSLRLFGSRYDNELQHNVVMTVPYGEVTYGEHVLGGTLRYEQPELLENVGVEVVTSLAQRQTDFRDASEWIYDWYGSRLRERLIAGEIQSDPTDQSIWQWSFFGRAYLKWTPHPEHELGLSVSPQYATRTGRERIQSSPGGRDPLTARRDLFTMVTGLEYRLHVLEDRLENLLFSKHYLYFADSEEVLPGPVFRSLARHHDRFGVGDAFRFRFEEWIWAKASYEFATRLPNPDEVFGNGVLVVPNLELAPETSHNVNISLHVDWRNEELGRWTGELNLFARIADQLIVLIGNERVFSYHNVYGATSLGSELALGWESPGRYVSIDLNGTFQDVRNTSSEGTFGAFDGDRIPNRPWLFANAAVSLRLPRVANDCDALVLGWDLRYVHEFYRSWESQGRRDLKQLIPSQLVQGLALSYEIDAPQSLTTTFEIQNLTDERTFDFFGVQRPGRTFFLKITGELQ